MTKGRDISVERELESHASKMDRVYEYQTILCWATTPVDISRLNEQFGDGIESLAKSGYIIDRVDMAPLNTGTLVLIVMRRDADVGV